MATGFLHKGVCFASFDDATAAHWSENPVAVQPGPTSYLSDVVWSGSTWVIRKFTLSSAGVLTLDSSTATPALGFPSCDPMQAFNDGAQIGTGVAAAIVIAYVIRVIGWGTK